MFTYVCQRLLLLLPTFIGVTLVAFFIIHLAPGDPSRVARWWWSWSGWGGRYIQ